MVLTLRDDAGMRGTRGPETRAADAESGVAPRPRAATASGRQRYVVGVFATPSDADCAITELASGACEVLVLSDAAPSRAAKLAVESSGSSVAYHRIDTSGTLAQTLQTMLSTSPPFAGLDLSLHCLPGELHPPPGMQRLFQNLVHHLATGAAVVIVHASGAEQQLWISRALLDAKCDVLLTHDVQQAPSASDPDHGEGCCEACTSRSCGRIDPARNGTSEAQGTKA